MLCEVDRSYIEDGFNLYGLRHHFANFQGCLDIILDRTVADEPQDPVVAQSAFMLYGMIHARFIVTARGLEAMYKKYRLAEFGRCPRTMCKQQPVVPVGIFDEPKKEAVKLYCPRCGDVYNTVSPYGGEPLDGAFFGTSFAHLFFITFDKLVPEPAREVYTPLIFGFKIHKSAKCMQRRLPHSNSPPPHTNVGSTAAAAAAAAAAGVSSASSSAPPYLKREPRFGAGGASGAASGASPGARGDANNNNGNNNWGSNSNREAPSGGGWADDSRNAGAAGEAGGGGKGMLWAGGGAGAGDGSGGSAALSGRDGREGVPGGSGNGKSRASGEGSGSRKKSRTSASSGTGGSGKGSKENRRKRDGGTRGRDVQDAGEEEEAPKAGRRPREGSSGGNRSRAGSQDSAASASGRNQSGGGEGGGTNSNTNGTGGDRIARTKSASSLEGSCGRSARGGSSRSKGGGNGGGNRSGGSTGGGGGDANSQKSGDEHGRGGSGAGGGNGGGGDGGGMGGRDDGGEVGPSSSANQHRGHGQQHEHPSRGGEDVKPRTTSVGSSTADSREDTPRKGTAGGDGAGAGSSGSGRRSTSAGRGLETLAAAATISGESRRNAHSRAGGGERRETNNGDRSGVEGGVVHGDTDRTTSSDRTRGHGHGSAPDGRHGSGMLSPARVMSTESASGGGDAGFTPRGFSSSAGATSRRSSTNNGNNGVSTTASAALSPTNNASLGGDESARSNDNSKGRRPGPVGLSPQSTQSQHKRGRPPTHKGAGRVIRGGSYNENDGHGRGAESLSESVKREMTEQHHEHFTNQSRSPDNGGSGSARGGGGGGERLAPVAGSGLGQEDMCGVGGGNGSHDCDRDAKRMRLG